MEEQNLEQRIICSRCLLHEERDALPGICNKGRPSAPIIHRGRSNLLNKPRWNNVLAQLVEQKSERAYAITTPPVCSMCGFFLLVFRVFAQKWDYGGWERIAPRILFPILGDPGADKGGEGKSKQEGKCGTKKSKDLTCRILKIQDWICRILKIQDLTCRILKFQDLACRILKFYDLTCRILNFQDLTCRILRIQNFVCRILKIQDLACRILKFQDSACQILNFQDSAWQILNFEDSACQILKF